ncbi:MAG: dihydrodipicolinate synthase family protein [Fuerstiella sp.]|nr:dihydrodipicolinate synthase family protein [Fuerstiella sp.]MCP4505941.1 dihydrodipicolinate synthase family protein [Fuerstiella sp.]MCP4857921.1 dihydrodipicolinate synthase family protein [Fuerstiella sp.]MDG2130389.1 dihydrodipicolinate synthase family protein [Fuerstiella sp.]
MPRFSGIIPPVVTPLTRPDQLDVDAARRIVEHLLTGGVNGLFVLGTTGEGPSLTYQIRYEMVEVVCEAAASRVSVLVGVTDTSLAESLHLAEHAAANGAAAIVAAAPYYFATSQNAVADWFRQLADSSPLPLVLYNMPGCVGIHLALDTVTELSAHPNIVGVKDSSGELDYFQHLCAAFCDDSDFAVFMGPEELIPQAVAAGADGGVCGGGNLLPRTYVDLFAASKRADESEIRRLSNVVEQVFEHVYRDPSGEMNLIPALKLAMRLRGICTGCTAPPLPPLTPEHTTQITVNLAKVLNAAGVESAASVPAS